LAQEPVPLQIVKPLTFIPDEKGLPDAGGLPDARMAQSESEP
jgi:hypothetical protein